MYHRLIGEELMNANADVFTIRVTPTRMICDSFEVYYSAQPDAVHRRYEAFRNYVTGQVGIDLLAQQVHQSALANAQGANLPTGAPGDAPAYTSAARAMARVFLADLERRADQP
jgi:hypothetical protein